MMPSPEKRELKEFKFLLQSVFVVMEGDQIVGEEITDQIVFYSRDELKRFLDERFDSNLAELNANH